MTTLEMINRLTEIFLDIVLPVVVLWIGYSIRQWLPKESDTHIQVSQLMTALYRVFSEADMKTAAEQIKAKEK